MHSVNLDLLRTGPYHPDGRPKDPHAHHRAELAALARAERRSRWSKGLTRLRRLLTPPAARPVVPARQD